MNARFQMQGGKNWILPKEMNANRFFWDSHWPEMVKLLMFLYGTEWRERGYGLRNPLGDGSHRDFVSCQVTMMGFFLGYSFFNPYGPSHRFLWRRGCHPMIQKCF